MLPALRSMRRLLVAVLLVAALAALPASTATARPTQPVAHAAVAPLAVPVATFILKELAVGVLNKAGGEAFGAALSELGIGGDPNAARLKAVDEKLDRIEVTLKELHTKVEGIAAALNMARLSAVRHSLSELTGHISEARARLQQLTDGSIQTASVRSQKRAELLDLIRTKLLHEQSRMYEAIVSASGNDDIARLAFKAERERRRFWSDDDWHRAYPVVGYYRDLAAELLYFRVEYEYSSITPSSTPEEVADRKELVKKMVDGFNSFGGRMNEAMPTIFGIAGDSLVVDTKPYNGKTLVWTLNNGRRGITSNKTVNVASHTNLLPTRAEFRHLVAGRANGQKPVDYLTGQGYIIPMVCHRELNFDDIPRSDPRTTESAQWTRDVDGGRRWVWAPWDDGVGQLNYGCDQLRIRELYPWEHPLR